MSGKLIQHREFTDLLRSSVTRYQNREVETAQIIEGLIPMAKQFQQSAEKGEQSGLNSEEMCFYDALTTNEVYIPELGNETLKKISQELAERLREGNTVGQYVRDSVQAKLKVMVKTVLK